MTLKEIVEKRANLLKQFKEYVHGDEWDKATADKIYEDIEKLDEQKRAIEQADELFVQKEELKQEAKETGFYETLDGFIRKGIIGGAESREKIQEIELRANQFYRGTANKGGSLVPALLGDYIEVAKAFVGGMVTPGLVDWRTTGTGNEQTFATVDDTATEAAVIAEKTDAASGTDVTYGTSALTFYKITTKFVKVSAELIQDSVYDVVDHVLELLSMRMQRGLNNYFTLGTGSSQPYGVHHTSTKGEDGPKRSITRTDLSNLIYSVDRAYRANGTFMFNDNTMKAIRALDIGSADARPVWSESMQKGEPPLLEGYPVIVNPKCDDLEAYNFPVFFGDFKNYKVREALPMKLQRADELYIETDEIGFNLIGRWAGNLISAGAPIKHIRCAST